ncbi:hypothetical protein QBC40DRAFT_211959 [Triangularia verruculosa]|uniref:CST complex subunit Stn1 N-terminal domain-containing protein n=1 Tax=Triangularia verruculosa TaxID=2587418 RepID=A0AAN6X910_9PEZI|nr:hypothetical protein QBC40DRAFT_211959 [Triangularia verruculosa]
MADSGSAPPELEFYPQFCFHLSPTIGRWCHLRATDIAALTFNPGFEGQDVYFYGNHPIKWARIAGVVVAIQEFAHRIIYTIDDSSGATIECVVATPPQFPAVTNYKTPRDPNLSADGKPLPKIDGPIDVGHIIDIKGGISIFRDVKQIRAEKITHLRTTEQEAVFWGKIALLRKEVLCRPWVLDSREVRKLRREEEGRERKKKRTGLERESKRRKLEDDTTVQDDDGERTRFSRKTGLERSTKSDGVVVAEVAKDGRHSHHHRTGLERRTISRAAVQDQEPGSPDRHRRKTGLEPRRPSVGDNARPVARPRQPLERPDLDETMSSSHFQRKTGLEKGSTQSRTHKPSVLEPADDTTLSTTRRTGLERRGSRKAEHRPTTNLIQKTGLEKSSMLEPAEDTTLSTIRSTGLEKRSSGSVEYEPASTLHSQKTGLERKSSLRRQETEDATVISSSSRPHRTGLERTTRRPTEHGHKTGLERQSSRGQDKQPSAHHRSTGLESKKQMQRSSDVSQPRITGLERQSSRKALMEKSSQNSQPDQQLQEEDKCEPKVTTLRLDSIKRPDSPVLVRGNGRLTGLERVTKPITRSPPVTGKYDSMGR